jgi:hypothetical protein
MRDMSLLDTGCLAGLLLFSLVLPLMLSWRVPRQSPLRRPCLWTVWLGQALLCIRRCCCLGLSNCHAFRRGFRGMGLRGVCRHFALATSLSLNRSAAYHEPVIRQRIDLGHEIAFRWRLLFPTLPFPFREDSKSYLMPMTFIPSVNASGSGKTRNEAGSPRWNPMMP